MRLLNIETGTVHAIDQAQEAEHGIYVTTVCKAISGYVDGERAAALRLTEIRISCTNCRRHLERAVRELTK